MPTSLRGQNYVDGEVLAGNFVFVHRYMYLILFCKIASCPASGAMYLLFFSVSGRILLPGGLLCPWRGHCKALE